MPMQRGLTTLACAVGLVTPALWFGSLVTPGEEAVKIRNGFVAEVADASEFDWQPGEVPPTFKLNRSDPTEQFRRAAESIRAGTPGIGQRGLDTAVAISRHLMQAPERRGGAIQSRARVAAATALSRLSEIVRRKLSPCPADRKGGAPAGTGRWLERLATRSINIP